MADRPTACIMMIESGGTTLPGNRVNKGQIGKFCTSCTLGP
jgi:hypothetical protein